MLKKGSKVRYLGETTWAYENGKIYEVVGYSEELDAWGVTSEYEDAYMVSEEYLEEVPEESEWTIARDDLIATITSLGFPDDLGNEIAKTLGSPKAIRRMNSYLRQVRPDSVELVVDEMLAIRVEIDAWREKKEALDANARYNEMRYYGLFDSDGE